MHSWEPQTSSTEEGRAAFAARTARAIQGLRRGAEVADEASWATLLQGLTERPYELLHPETYSWYFGELERRKTRPKAKGAEPRVGEGIAALAASIGKGHRRAAENLRRHGIPVDLDPGADGAATLARLEATASKIAGQPVTIGFLTPTADLVSGVSRAFEVLREHWPEAFEEIRTFVQRLVFFKGKTAIGAADFGSHGAIFLKVETVDDPISLGEEILHESSHVRLNAMMACAPVVLNDPAERFSSPLRRDPRPMFGLFHQIFVLSRLKRYYQRVGKESGKFDEIREQLRMGAAVVRQYGRLSDEGKVLFETIVAVAEAA